MPLLLTVIGFGVSGIGCGGETPLSGREADPRDTGARTIGTSESKQEIAVYTPAGTRTEMVLAPKGKFTMGSENGSSNERPVHTVYLDGYYIDRYEVTNEQFKAFVAATGYKTTAERMGLGYVLVGSERKELRGADWRHPRGPGDDLSDRMDHPVVQVSCYDGQAYCTWAGKRLPTEAEWEKAARGTDGRMYPWGDEWDPARLNWEEGGVLDGFVYTAPAGKYPAGTSPYGVHNMAGNVLEWCADRYDNAYYSKSPGQNPQGPSDGDFRVLRGGSWYGTRYGARCTLRHKPLAPSGRSDLIGFRCAR